MVLNQTDAHRLLGMLSTYIFRPAPFPKRHARPCYQQCLSQRWDPASASIAKTRVTCGRSGNRQITGDEVRRRAWLAREQQATNGKEKLAFSCVHAHRHTGATKLGMA